MTEQLRAWGITDSASSESPNDALWPSAVPDAEEGTRSVPNVGGGRGDLSQRASWVHMCVLCRDDGGQPCRARRCRDRPASTDEETEAQEASRVQGDSDKGRALEQDSTPTAQNNGFPEAMAPACCWGPVRLSSSSSTPRAPLALAVGGERRSSLATCGHQVPDRQPTEASQPP